MSAKPQTILVTRFSAMGDVAMTIPVMQQILQANPGLQIIFASNKNLGALCAGIPGLHFFSADLKGEHKGFKGLYQLYRSISKAYRIDAVADLHQVLRSQILRTFFKLSGRRVAVIDKGRAEKKALTRQENKILQPLTSTIERYAAVFRQLGFKADIDPSRPVFTCRALPPQVVSVTGEKGHWRWIGLAPFAAYQEKTYPLEKMKEVLTALLKKPHTRVFLMGGGAAEIARLNELAKGHPAAMVLAGRFSLPEELAVTSQLDMMISMDSANMHLASLFGIPVVSVWGATHPFAGFMGFGQSIDNAVQINDLNCRPCSVFGNKPCFRGDHACMEWLPPEAIIQKIVFAE